MAYENIDKTNSVVDVAAGNYRLLSKSKIIILFRVLAILATLSATIVMALNKETKNVVVATVGTYPLRATVSAKFQDSPANIFFVIANGLATIYNIVVVIRELLGDTVNPKRCRLTVIIPILDMIMLVVVSSAACSATIIADLAKRGNTHASWNKICDKFDTFCDHGGGALLASFIGVACLLVANILAKLDVQKRREAAEDAASGPTAVQP